MGVSVEEIEEGVAISLDSLSEHGEDLEQLVKVAQEIGPVAVGRDREDFREAVKADESIKEWKGNDFRRKIQEGKISTVDIT